MTAVGRIDRTISDVEAVANSIAAAVEQQGAATAEIARNVAETATAANDMTACVADVSDSAANTGRHAGSVREGAANLKDAVDQLRGGVIRAVRTSSEDVDRRMSARHSVEQPCRIKPASGAVQDATIADISREGARIQGGPSMRANERGTLTISGTAIVVPFVVRDADGQGQSVQFVTDAAAATQIDALINRLTTLQVSAA